jgi:ABC-type antimicrobial peptide transport system permease subunit
VVFVMRAVGTPAAYRDSVRRAMVDISPDAVVEDVTTIGDRLASSVRDRTFATLVLALFFIAGGAVTIAGLVGIVSFVVARRTREMAIRLAIGADRFHIRRLVVREAVSAAIVGGAVGMLAGRWLSKFLEGFVFGIAAGNWTTVLSAGALMLVLMISAALVSARRAMRLQPTEALRVE